MMATGQKPTAATAARKPGASKKAAAPKKAIAKSAEVGKAPPRQPQFVVIHTEVDIENDETGHPVRGRVVGLYRSVKEANDVALDFFCQKVDELFRDAESKARELRDRGYVADDDNNPFNSFFDLLEPHVFEHNAKLKVRTWTTEVLVKTPNPTSQVH